MYYFAQLIKNPSLPSGRHYQLKKQDLFCSSMILKKSIKILNFIFNEKNCINKYCFKKINFFEYLVLKETLHTLGSHTSKPKRFSSGCFNNTGLGQGLQIYIYKKRIRYTLGNIYNENIKINATKTSKTICHNFSIAN